MPQRYANLVSPGIWALIGGVVGSLVGPTLTPFFDYFWGGRSRKEQEREARRDNLVANIDSQCRELRDVACSYWNNGAADLGKEDAILSGRILGIQHEVSSLNARLFVDHPSLRSQAVASLLEFMDEVSGGDFGDAGRLPQTQFLAAINIADARYRAKVHDLRRRLNESDPVT